MREGPRLAFVCLSSYLFSVSRSHNIVNWSTNFLVEGGIILLGYLEGFSYNVQNTIVWLNHVTFFQLYQNMGEREWLRGVSE